MPRDRLRFAYFAYFAYLGAWGPYWTWYLKRGLGLDDGMAGTLWFVLVGSLIAGGLWAGRLADRLRCRRGILLVASALGAVVSAGWWWVRTPAQTIALAALQGLTAHVLMALLDATAADALGPERRRFGAIRLYGTAGWGAGAWLVGTARDAHAGAVVAGMVAALALFHVAAWILPNTQAAVPAAAARPRMDLGAAARSPAFLLLLGTTFLNRFAYAPYDAFMTPYLESVGFSADQTSLLYVIGIASEVIVFWAAPSLIRRFPDAALVAVALAVTSVRWWVTPDISSPAALMALQSCHGLSFGLWYAAAFHTVGRIVRPEVSTTGQALFGIAGSSGVGAGALIAGQTLERTGMTTVFEAASLVVGAAALAMILGARILGNPPAIGAVQEEAGRG